MFVIINSIDQTFDLDTGEFTLRQLASDARLVVRCSDLYRPADAKEPQKLWVDIENLGDPNRTVGFEISQETYDELVALGVLESSLGLGG